jgi:nucleoside-diphosphate kinase
VEETFIMLKPEVNERRIIGEIISRIEKHGFKIVAMKMTLVSKVQAEKLYEMHLGKPFYPELVEHITSGPVVLMVVKGSDAIMGMRKLIGATNPVEAERGTIRKEFGINKTKNVIHAADSPENAEREIKIFFNRNEIME